MRELEAALDAFAPRGDVLELAAGTGLWTRHLVRYADRVTAVDAVAEVLDLNRVRNNAKLADARHLVSATGEVARRRLSDGREFDIVKRFWDPAELEREVAAVGVRATANGYFIAASGARSG